MSEAVERPMPGMNEDNQRYWESARKRALELPRCEGCGEVFYPLSSRCRKCLSASLTWKPVSGKATLVTWNVMHQVYDPAFASLAPYVVAVVKLEEGAQLISNIIDVAPGTLQAGMPLEVDYIDLNDEVTLPVYRVGAAV